MKEPEITHPEHATDECPPGYKTIASIQTNGHDLAVQIDEGVIPILDSGKVRRLVGCLQYALYRLRPDLRKQ